MIASPLLQVFPFGLLPCLSCVIDVLMGALLILIGILLTTSSFDRTGPSFEVSSHLQLWLISK